MRNTIVESNIGSLVSVRGSVVEIRFERDLPAIYSLLRAGKDGRIAIEVLSQLDVHRVPHASIRVTLCRWE